MAMTMKVEIDQQKLTALLEQRVAGFAELREAWIDLPFCGQVPQGWGESLQRLINAVSAVVDPDRTLREEPEVKRRGGIASYRQQFAFAADTLKQAREQLADIEREEPDGVAAKRWRECVAKWQATCDDLEMRCATEFGVQCTI